jgi:hypothetical protein
MTLVYPKFILLTTIQVGERIKDRKERVFGYARERERERERERVLSYGELVYYLIFK